MRSLVVVVVGSSACGFTPTVEAVQPDAQLGTTGTTQSTCHTSAPGVRLCLDFEDPSLVPVIADVSGDHNNAAAAFVTAIAERGQHVAVLTPSSAIAVAESSDLDIPNNVSIEMWIRPDTIQDSSWLLSNTAQYAVGIDQGALYCEFGGHGFHANDPLVSGAWSHVACTYDGMTMKAYIDGNVSGCQPDAGTIPNVNYFGTTIGYGYVGHLDDVHVYAHTLTDAEVRAQAGAATGNTMCPPKSD